MPRKSAIGADEFLHEIAALTPENGKAIGWEEGAIANINPSAAQSPFIYGNNQGSSFQTAGANQSVFSFTIPGGTIPSNRALAFDYVWTPTGTGSKTVTLTVGGLSVINYTATNASIVYGQKKVFNRNNNQAIFSASTIVIDSLSGGRVVNSLNWNNPITVALKVSVATDGQGVTFDGFSATLL